jgi:hypothetical protein
MMLAFIKKSFAKKIRMRMVVSVSVRVKSRKERNSDSPVPIYGQTHFDTAVLNGVQLESHLGESSKFQLPSIFAPRGGHPQHFQLMSDKEFSDDVGIY